MAKDVIRRLQRCHPIFLKDVSLVVNFTTHDHILYILTKNQIFVDSAHKFNINNLSTPSYN